MYTISQLFIYPVKSLGGFEINVAQLTDRGFQYDRRWMLIDNNNQFLTQREHPEMALLQTTIEGDSLVIYYKPAITDKISISLTPAPAIPSRVNIWDDGCDAQFVSDVADEWLSKKLSMSCRLVYMPDAEKRKVDGRYAANNEITAFSDGYPLMMIGQASLDDLNSRLEESLPMNRFRPNIVFTGGNPFDEDLMEHIKVNGIDLYGVKLCARCVMTTINQDSGLKSKEPLKTLTGYRNKQNKIYFGQNILFKQTGCIRQGDTINIIKIKPSALDSVKISE
jgi:uncharacterized protein YcbX